MYVHACTTITPTHMHVLPTHICTVEIHIPQPICTTDNHNNNNKSCHSPLSSGNVVITAAIIGPLLDEGLRKLPDISVYKYETKKH